MLNEDEDILENKSLLLFEQLRLPALKDLERTSRMGHVFQTGSFKFALKNN